MYDFFVRIQNSIIPSEDDLWRMAEWHWEIFLDDNIFSMAQEHLKNKKDDGAKIFLEMYEKKNPKFFNLTSLKFDIFKDEQIN